MIRTTLHLKNDLVEVRRMVEAVEDFCDANGIAPGLAMKFAVALDEIATNIVSYAFPEGGEHVIEVELVHGGGSFGAVVRDDGLAFNPLDLPPPDLDVALEDRPIGGLGIHFVRTMMDTLDYDRCGGRNVLSFTKTIDRGTDPGATLPA